MVAQKLVDVANIVIGIGKSCEIHGVGEEELARFGAVLQPFQRCVDSLPSSRFTPSKPVIRNLEEIGGLLRECAEYGKFKKVLNREEIQKKVKQCDDKLSHALGIFQVRL